MSTPPGVGSPAWPAARTSAANLPRGEGQLLGTFFLRDSSGSARCPAASAGWHGGVELHEEEVRLAETDHPLGGHFPFEQGQVFFLGNVGGEVTNVGKASAQGLQALQGGTGAACATRGRRETANAMRNRVHCFIINPFETLAKRTDAQRQVAAARGRSSLWTSPCTRRNRPKEVTIRAVTRRESPGAALPWNSAWLMAARKPPSPSAWPAAIPPPGPWPPPVARPEKPGEPGSPGPGRWHWHRVPGQGAGRSGGRDGGGADMRPVGGLQGRASPAIDGVVGPLGGGC